MSDQTTAADPQGDGAASRRFLFGACFNALVATSFAFIIRVMVMDSWQLAFNLTETQKGEIFGAGLWPFGVSIVLFSLMLDKLGYNYVIRQEGRIASCVGVKSANPSAATAVSPSRPGAGSDARPSARRSLASHIRPSRS